MDQFTGKLSYFKVMSGKVAADADLVIAREGKKEKITKIHTCLGKKLEDVAELVAGDLGLFTKSAALKTNDTLHAPNAPIIYPDLELPTPVHSLAITAKAKKDEDKMNQMLHRVTEEDHTFRLSYDKETKETVISGMGELHISMILDKIRENQKIEMETKIPRVAYRETILGKAEAEYAHKKQTGGHGQYARVSLEVNPIPRGEKYKFTNAIFGGAISKGLHPRHREGRSSRPWRPATSPATRWWTWKPGSWTARSTRWTPRSSPSSWPPAEAFRECVRNAKPVLLEPVCNLTVFVDEQYLGAVLSDLSGKRGKVQGQNPIGGGILEIKAQVPQAELMHYAIDLKALTASTGSFELEFDHYSPISGRIAEDVIKAAQAAKAEEKEKD